MPKTEAPRCLRDLMAPQVPYSAPWGPHRALRNPPPEPSSRRIRWKLFTLLDSGSLRSLRHTSKYFLDRVCTENERIFKTVRLKLDLSDRCELNNPDSLLALERIRWYVKRLSVTFRGGGAIHYELRHSTDPSRRSTLNPVPLEGHFGSESEYYLKEARTPALGGLFEDLSPGPHAVKGFFQEVFDRLPKLRRMALYFAPAGPGQQHHWGRTLLDEALIHLRCQYEASLRDRANLTALKLHLDSPLALWHFRSFPAYGVCGPTLWRESPWRNVKILDLSLPTYNISHSSQRMKIMKRGIHSFLSAFSSTVKELSLSRGDIGNPLVYDLEPDNNFNSYMNDGNGDGNPGRITPIGFPKLNALTLISMSISWNGLEKFLTSPERGCMVMSLVLDNVRISGPQAWEKLFTHFELDHPEKMKDPAAPLRLSRKIDLVPVSLDNMASGRLRPTPNPY